MVHNVLIRESIFGFKGQGIYDLRNKGGLFGSIGDVTEEILLKRGYGIYYTELKRILMSELEISEHSINNVLFLYDIKKRFIKSGNQVLLSKWLGQGQLSLDIE